MNGWEYMPPDSLWAYKAGGRVAHRVQHHHARALTWCGHTPRAGTGWLSTRSAAEQAQIGDILPCERCAAATNRWAWSRGLNEGQSA